MDILELDNLFPFNTIVLLLLFKISIEVCFNSYLLSLSGTPLTEGLDKSHSSYILVFFNNNLLYDLALIDIKRPYSALRIGILFNLGINLLDDPTVYS